jgi:hypothetical protein
MQTEQWFCPNHYCATEAWLVQQCADNDELWFVTCRLNGAAYTVAAVDPVCPRCGTTLCATIEIAHQERGVLEEGPMLDFVRSLR